MKALISQLSFGYPYYLYVKIINLLNQPVSRMFQLRLFPRKPMVLALNLLRRRIESHQLMLSQAKL